jgi:hypothetical protein
MSEGGVVPDKVRLCDDATASMGDTHALYNMMMDEGVALPLTNLECGGAGLQAE